MYFDERFFGANATKASRDAWAEDQWPHIEVVWIFLILLHFAALVHIDPVLVHFLSLLLARFIRPATPVVGGDSSDGVDLVAQI